MIKYTISSFVIIFSFLLLPGCTGNDNQYLVTDGFTQGTTYHIVYSNEAGIELDSIVTNILLSVDSSLSVYNSSSVVSKVNRGESVVTDSLFISVLDRSRDFYEMSGGLFDVSASALFNIWGFGFEERGEVSSSMVDSALSISGMDKVHVEDGRVWFDEPGMTLNFNAIAQGYTCDVISGEFDAMGVENYLIEVGGEIMSKGKNPSGKLWSVGIDKPKEGNVIQGADLQDIILISGRGLATSGNYRKFYKKDGEVFSHTINPLTGYPVRHNLLSATVIATDAMMADAYATWFMVIGLEEAIEIIEREAAVDAYLVYAEGEEYKVYKSEGIRVRK